jgi:aminopeptidase N
MTYRMRIATPAAVRAVVPGALDQEVLADGRRQARFTSESPLPGIDLLAGPYQVDERRLRLPSGRDVLLRTYFHSELAALAPRYLDAAEAHLERYDRALGAYAFASYSVVSSPLPVGFGMPGIAYLGKEVLRLPFIPATSLRHEVLHDWWGNGVLPDYAHGNWAEGLTTLLADHALREEQGEAQALRAGWLRDYAAVPPAADKPLASFRARRHGADQAVGYHKTAFVFFMLRDWIGAGAFDAALRSFWRDYRLRTADWSALQRAFEAQSGHDLDFFFTQWVRRAGAPRLEVAAARNESTADGVRVRIVLRQQDPPYRLRVPLRIHHALGHVDAVVETGATEARFVLAVPAPAKAIEIDAEARLFRRLHDEEIVPTLREVFLHPETKVVLASDGMQVRSRALEVARSVLESKASAVDSAVTPSGPLLIVGLHADVARLLARWEIEPREVPQAHDGGAFAYAARTPSGEPLAVVSAEDGAELSRLTRSLPHLGARSYAVFSQGRSIARGLWTLPRRLHPVRP